MNDIFKSASKIVLLALVAVLGLLSIVAGVVSIVTDNFGEASKVILLAFGNALTFVFGFYFNSKGDPNQTFGGK